MEEMEPTAGLSDQVTALEVPVTVAVNCWVCPAFKLVVKGEALIFTGTRVMVEEAVAPLVEVAVTEMVCAVTEAGAV